VTAFDEENVADRQAESHDIEGDHLPAKTLELPVDDQSCAEENRGDSPSGPRPEQDRPGDREHHGTKKDQLEASQDGF
jgi:hypothetical protein